MSELRFEHAPIRVFVVWHPSFKEGTVLCSALHEWLGGHRRELHRCGLGVPVHAWTSSHPEDPPAPPPLDSQSLTVVVALVDGELAGRPRWRRWFDSLISPPGSEGSPVVVLPWAVHPAAARLSRISLIHLLGSEQCEANQLCRRVTEACVIRLRAPQTPTPLRIFLSYARRDGAQVAAEVRRALQAYGHLSVFLDEHDLQPGEAWRGELGAELDRGAAMFAVVTDAYAGRAWCRKELQQFRVPQPEEDGSNRWWLRPVFVLEHLGGCTTRSIGELGNAPVARWDPTRALEVVDNFVREILFAEANRARTRLVNAGPEVQLINWVPDTWTLLHLLRRRPSATRIAYPGDGLLGAEAEHLAQLFPGIALSSFEELSRKAVPRRRTAEFRTPVLLSISDPPPDQLAKLGLTSAHLDDFAVRLARTLLYEDFDVMYGGRPRNGFTDSFQDDSGMVVLDARLINHLGWPFTLKLGAPQVADGFGITRYVRIPSDNEARANEEDPWAVARAATATRHAAVHQSLKDLDDRVIPRPVSLVALGGQLTDFGGFLPGVAEEIAMAIEAGIPVFVLGGLGGAAGAAARLLEGGKAPELSLRAFRTNGRYQRLLAAAKRHGRPGEPEQRLRWMLSRFRKAHRLGLRNGLSAEDNRELLRTTDFGRALALVSRGLRTLPAGSPAAQPVPPGNGPGRGSRKTSGQVATPRGRRRAI